MLGEDQTWGNVTTNPFTVSGPVSGPGRLTIIGSYTIQVPAADTGSATRPETHAGTGSIVLTGANTYTGGTVVSSGTLVADKPRRLRDRPRRGPRAAGGDPHKRRRHRRRGEHRGRGERTRGFRRGRHGARRRRIERVHGRSTGRWAWERGGRVRLPGGTLTAKGGIVNEGTVRVERGGALAVGAGHPFVNGGVLEIMDNRFSLSAAFTNRGTVIDGSAVPTQSASLAGGVLSLKVEGRAGRAYQLQRGPSLTGGDFTNVGPPQSTAADAVLTFVDDKPDAARGFYRVRATP